MEVRSGVELMPRSHRSHSVRFRVSVAKQFLFNYEDHRLGSFGVVLLLRKELSTAKETIMGGFDANCIHILSI